MIKLEESFSRWKENKTKEIITVMTINLSLLIFNLFLIINNKMSHLNPIEYIVTIEIATLDTGF